MNPKKAGDELKEAILEQFDISDQAGLEILEQAIQSYIRMEQAREIVDKDGLTYTNRFNEIREHPSLNTERKARSQFLQALKQLSLDIVPILKGR
ncbi:MAG: P27 family phage terminase small subunit [Deltaproteobacteria bacterium]|nr:P27 family phage terminase small subunit [Deltaproteobacteria bacterium]